MRTKNGAAYLPFGYKLMLSYAPFILLPIVLAGYLANAVYIRSVEERTIETNRAVLQQMKNNIGYKLADVERIANMFYVDEPLKDLIDQYEAGWVGYDIVSRYLLPRIQNGIETAAQRVWLSIYFANDRLPEIYHRHAGDPLDSYGPAYDLYHLERIRDAEWYKTFPPERYGQTRQWKQIEDDAAYGRISLLRRLVDASNPLRLEEVAFMRLSVRLADLLESVDRADQGRGTAVYIVDGGGRVIASAGGDGASMAEPGSVLPVNPDERIVIREQLPQLGWQLVGHLPDDMTAGAARRVTLWTVFICVGCAAAFLFAGAAISRHFAGKVSDITALLDAFQEGEFGRRTDVRGNDEFARIAAALNEMGGNIGELIQKVYVAGIQKKEAELESLQAQINPHFLYNTLSSIGRLAKFGRTDGVQRMVLDLAKFYRLTLNEGRIMIPIHRELEQAEAYANIQKTKFGEGMSIFFDVDPSVMAYETVKLILQPFVENVLEHAWVGDRIHIRIEAKSEGERIVFKVIDDGHGMPSETLRQLSDPKERLNVGYGISNVDQRIKLHFGDAYGVTIVSRLGIGTTVRIVIPKTRSVGRPGDNPAEM